MLKLSSGPCAKHKGWSLSDIDLDLMGRSHRSEEGVRRIKFLISEIKDILNIPNNYYVGIVAGSATGAMESLLWSLVGARGVDVLSASIFSGVWEHDIRSELSVPNVRSLKSEFGSLSGLNEVDFSNDVVFCWTETTSGVSVNNADWISDTRVGLTICDATSAVFCSRIDWNKLDATAFSWQKGVGGEAGLGTIVLSPRAIDRLQQYIPKRAMPRIYKLATDGVVNFGIFEGKTINTPSMLCIEEYISNLKWARSVGGLSGLLNRVDVNYNFMREWEKSQDIFQFYVRDEYHRARNVLCFDLNIDSYRRLSEADKWEFLKRQLSIAEQDGVVGDILGHALTVPHIRIWCGPTIELSDLKMLTGSISKYFS